LDHLKVIKQLPIFFFVLLKEI